MMHKQSIWILEDDPGACFVYEQILSADYDIHFFTDLNSLHKATAKPPSLSGLILADLRLPDGNFLNFLTQLHQSKSNDFYFPNKIIVVSSLDDIDVLRSCYLEGALDYITKPFSKNLLVTKIERILSLVQKLPYKIHIDPGALRLHVDSVGSTELTAKELQIMCLLIENPERAVSRERLKSAIWGSLSVSPKALDVHLTNLRKKLDLLSMDILFNAKDGYRLSPKK